MWKGKEEDSEGTQADVQATIPADSILPPSLSLLLTNLISPLCLSGAPEESEGVREKEREKEKVGEKEKARKRAKD